MRKLLFWFLFYLVSQPEGYSKCLCRNCGGSIEFPTVSAGEHATCPHCNKSTVLTDAAAWGEELPQEEPRSASPWLLLILVLLAGGAVLGWHFYQRRMATPPPPPVVKVVTNALPKPVEPPPPDLWHGLMPGPVSLEKEGVGRLVYAVGVLTNKSDHERYGIKVELSLFDTNHDKIGSATDYTGSILPDKVWRYKALITSHKVSYAQLVSVTEN